MPKKTIVFSVRNFPAELNRELKAEAARRGTTLQDFTIAVILEGLAALIRGSK